MESKKKLLRWISVLAHVQMDVSMQFNTIVVWNYFLWVMMTIYSCCTQLAANRTIYYGAGVVCVCYLASALVKFAQCLYVNVRI